MVVKIEFESGRIIDVNLEDLFNEVKNCFCFDRYIIVNKNTFDCLIKVLKVMGERIEEGYSIEDVKCVNEEYKKLQAKLEYKQKIIDKLKEKVELFEKEIKIRANSYKELVNKYDELKEEYDVLIKERAEDILYDVFKNDFDNLMKSFENFKKGKPLSWVNGRGEEKDKKLTACKQCKYTYGTVKCKATNDDITWNNGDIVKCNKCIPECYVSEEENEQSYIDKEEWFKHFLKGVDEISYNLLYGYME